MNSDCKHDQTYKMFSENGGVATEVTVCGGCASVIDGTLVFHQLVRRTFGYLSAPNCERHEWEPFEYGNCNVKCTHCQGIAKRETEE